MGAQNTLASGLGGAYNIYQQQQLLNQLSRNQSPMFVGDYP
jgi:hypothetical protein